MNIYFVPFKVIPIRYYTLVPTFFPILEALQKIIFCDLVQLLLRCRLYLLNRSVAFVLSWASSVSGTRKSHRGPDLGNTVAAESLVCCFWSKIRTQATMCEQGRYHGAKSQFLFFHKSGRFWRIASRKLRITCR